MPNNIDLAAAFNIDKLNEDLDKVLLKVTKLTDELEDSLKGGSVDKSMINKIGKAQQEQAKTVRVLEKAYGDLNQETKEYLKTKQLEDAARKRSLSTFKAQATVMDVTANSYERLKAQSKLATDQALRTGAALEMLKMKTGASEKEVSRLTAQFGKESAKAQELAHSLTRLEQSTGKMTSRTMGSYPAIFSFSQVLREMPNFAMSTRIGFMSLSNNIPMLADDFKRLTKEIDASTGKVLGTKGAFKILARELVGFNAIVILATTLLTMYGDKLVDWVSNLWDGADALGALEGAMIDVNKQFSDSQSKTNTLAADIELVMQALNGVEDGTVDTNRALQLYNSTLSQYLGKAKTVKEALDLTAQSSDKLRIAQGYLSAAQAENTEKWDTMAEIAKNRSEIIDDATKEMGASAVKSLLEIERADALMIETMVGGMYQQKNAMSEVGAAVRIDADHTLKRISDQTGVSVKYLEVLGKLYNQKLSDLELYKKADKAEKKAIENLKLANLALPLLSKNNDKREKQLRNIYKLEQDYSHWKATTELANQKLELKMSKETNEGVLNSYEERIEATQGYYFNVDRIAGINRQMAESKAKKQYALEREKLNDNLDKKAVSVETYDKQIAIAQANYRTKQTEINDKYQSETLSNLIDFNSNVTNINKDQYDLEVEYLEAKYDKEEKLRDEAFEKEKQAIKEKYKLTRMLGADDLAQSVESENAKFKNARKNILAEIDLLNDKLDKVAKGSEEERLLKKDLVDKKLDYEKSYRDETISISAIIADNKEEFENEIFSNAKKAAKATVDSLFQIRFDALDAERSYFNTIEDERLADTEDRLEAGVISEKEAEDKKARIQANAAAEQKRINDEEAELKRKQFLLEQGFALAQIAITTAKDVQAISGTAAVLAANPLTAALAPLALAQIPFVIGSAALQAGLITAQTIPFFEHGSDGELKADTLAVAGEKREEVAVHQGTPYLIPKGAAMYKFKKGTEIFPSVDDWIDNSTIQNDNAEISKMLNSISLNPSFNFSDANIVSELALLRKDINKSRPSNYGRKDYLSQAKRYRNQTKGIA